ncbi:MAG: response regulator [Desulfobacteraceae bacterium]|nr:response regulator [Desulfobacteraceae bacterium]
MKKKILAIDDETDTLIFYSEVLEDGNFIPITATNGIEGLKKARAEKPDLILLDIVMPKKSGMMTYKDLKRDPDLKGIPVIIITGVSKEVDFKKLLDRSSTGKIRPAGHLAKPLTADDLIGAIRNVLG